jgi:hypothetical protein
VAEEETLKVAQAELEALVVDKQVDQVELLLVSVGKQTQVEVAEAPILQVVEVDLVVKVLLL